MCEYVYMHTTSEVGVRFYEAAIPGSCDTAYMDEGILIQAFCKNSEDF